MFKNPLRKYQAGGTAPTQEQQELLAAFVEWLPQRIKEFANMQPEQIVEALNGMSKTEEGQKQVQGWMEQFKKEMQSAQPAQFKEGGKIHQFLCKHAKGGHVADCGCYQEGGRTKTSDSVSGAMGTLRLYTEPSEGSTVKRDSIFYYTPPKKDSFYTGGNTVSRVYLEIPNGRGYEPLTTTLTGTPSEFGSVSDFNHLRNIWNAYKSIEKNQDGGSIDRSKFVVPSTKSEVFNGGYLQSDTPEHAAALAARKTTRVPWPGVGRRRMGAAMDNNGGKYLYERGDVNGNTAQTSVSIPAPGDTIVRQSVATMDGWDNRTYPEGTDEYESVMKRFRPFVEYGIPAKQEGGELSRKDMFARANENRGFSRANTRIAYLNAKNGLRNNSDLRGKALRQAARRMVVGEPVVEEPITREPIGELKSISVPVEATTTFSTKLAGPTTFGMTQEGLDNMSFNDAFAAARREGNSRFIWRGKAYTTELATPPAQREQVVLWDPENRFWNPEEGLVYRQQGGTLSDQYGTINNDSRTPVRRWIDNVVGNNSTLSSVARGLNNFKQSTPGKVIQAMLPNPETGIAGAVTPVAKIAKAAKVRIPTQKAADNLALLTDNQKLQYLDNIKPSKIDFDIDKFYSGIKNTNFVNNIPKEPWYIKHGDLLNKIALGGLFGGAAYAGAKMGESENKKK